MFTLRKDPDRDFRVLNLTDPQLDDGDWAENRKGRKLLEYTVNALVKRTDPDLITVSGDLSYGGHETAYKSIGAFLDGFGVPWSFVFGNHDGQGGLEELEQAAKILTAGGKSLFEAGDSALGCGNYVITIEQNGVPLHALVMMDSHDRREYIGPDGNACLAYSDVLPGQIEWYRERISELSAAGVKETTLIMHIPLYNYHDAAKAAFKEGIDLKAVPPFDGGQKGFFKEGFEDGFGVMYEDICSYPEDNGFFDVIKACGSTKTVVCGHDHTNSFAVTYEGVRLVYSLKTGMGCYWDSRLNGGTLLTIDGGGKATAKHVFVDVSEFEKNI